MMVGMIQRVERNGVGRHFGELRSRRRGCNLRLANWVVMLCAAAMARAEVGDPQIGTDHPWYPGELACSSFVRLFASEGEQYRRATHVEPKTEQEKALAAWFWRNT